MSNLTQKDLREALDACGGFGYSTARNLLEDEDGLESEEGVRLVKILDAAVVARFNELGRGQDDLDRWVDSKLGRWLVDEASDLLVDEASVQSMAEGAQALVEKYVTVARLDDLRDLGISR